MTATDPDFVCGKWVDHDGAACILLLHHLRPCTATDNEQWVPVPQENFTEIAPRLWMGGAFSKPSSEDFDTVLTLHNGTPVAFGTNERRWHIPDAGVPDMGELDDHVRWVYHQWAIMHRSVLIRCQAGLNRSGLVTASVLMADGYSADEAIKLVREKRSFYALCNPRFETYLRGRDT